MDEFDDRRQVSFSGALESLPGRAGERYRSLFRHGSLEVEIYAPRGEDVQTPHERDEAYVVVRGRGTYQCGNERHSFGAGDFLVVQPFRQPLEVLLHGGDGRAVAVLEQRVLEVLRGRPPATLRRLPGDAAHALGRCLCEIHRKLIVLPAGVPPFEDEGIERLVAEAPSPLLLIRTERG